jgi:hypothetical protein
VRFEIRNGRLEVMAKTHRIGRLPSCLYFDLSADIGESTTDVIRFPGRSATEDRRRMAA